MIMYTSELIGILKVGEIYLQVGTQLEWSVD